MRADRLLTLADYLETVVILLPPERFTMDLWADGPLDSQPPEGSPTCGTSGCAGGWATTIPEFAAAGLRLVLYEWFDEAENRLRPIYHIGFGDLRNFEAVCAFFDISLLDSKLFEPRFYPETPTDVARRIRQFVKYHQEATKGA